MEILADIGRLTSIVGRIMIPKAQLRGQNTRRMKKRVTVVSININWQQKCFQLLQSIFTRSFQFGHMTLLSNLNDLSSKFALQVPSNIISKASIAKITLLIKIILARISLLFIH